MFSQISSQKFDDLVASGKFAHVDEAIQECLFPGLSAHKPAQDRDLVNIPRCSQSELRSEVEAKGCKLGTFYDLFDFLNDPRAKFLQGSKVAAIGSIVHVYNCDHAAVIDFDDGSHRLILMTLEDVIHDPEVSYLVTKSG